MEVHSSPDDELAALYALDVLEGDERERFERHLGSCVVCQQTVQRDQTTLSRLTDVAGEMEPTPDFKQRLLARAREEAGTGTAVQPAAELRTGTVPVQRVAEPEPRGRLLAFPSSNAAWRTRRALAALAAAVVVALGLGGYAGQAWYASQVLVAAPLAQTAALNTAGDAAASVVVRRSGQAELHTDHLPPLAPGQVYEAWIIPPGGSPIPAGTQAATAGSLTLPSSPLGKSVALTVEAAPGADAPTTPPILRGAVSG